MPRVALTEEQVARILAAPKTVNDDIRWRSKGNAMWAGCTVPVINELKQTLQLNANANLVDRTKYSFSLIASNSYRVAGFDANGSHKNTHRNTEKWLARSHMTCPPSLVQG